MSARRYFAVDVVMIWFFALLAGLVVCFFNEIPKAWHLLGLYLFCLALGFAIPWATGNWNIERQLLVRVIWIVPLILVAFSSLGFLIHYISPDDRHWHLLNWDRRIFGGDPLRKIHRLGTPAFTEFFQLCYVSYYFLPLALGIALYKQKRWKDLELTMTTITFGFFLSYLGYVIIPARSPNEILPGFWQQGWLISEQLAQWTRAAELIKRDCFPSGHLMITMITMGLAWHLHKKVFWAISLFSVGLGIATLYLGYHYILDLIAGAILAGFVLLVAFRTKIFQS